MKHLFIVNPVAGGKDKTEAVRAAAAQVFGEDFEIYRTTGPMDACRELDERGKSGEEYIVFSCGGDGTFNECCCGSANHKNLVLAPYPTGTGNDFCRMFGKEAALYNDLSALKGGRSHPIDLIKCNDRYSVNLCSVGFDARVGCNVHNYTSFPLCKGPVAYVVSLIVETIKGLNTHMVIDCGETHLDGKFALACVCNGRFYGGGFMPSKDAMPDDGELDVYICKEISFFKFILNIGKYSSGRSREVPQYIINLHGDSIKIKFDEAVQINVDGEVLISDTIDMKLEKGALNLLVPNGMTFFGAV